MVAINERSLKVMIPSRDEASKGGLAGSATVYIRICFQRIEVKPYIN